LGCRHSKATPPAAGSLAERSSLDAPVLADEISSFRLHLAAEGKVAATVRT